MRCDYISFAATIGKMVECKRGSCPHYGNCLPVIGIRETPPDAIGEHTEEKGNYYHNILKGEHDAKL